MDLWRTSEGLPQNAIGAIVQTRDGYLWLATQEGLVRFDGARFTIFTNVNTPALRDNHIETLFESSDGTLWIGVFGGGIIRRSNGTFQNVTGEIDPGQTEGVAQFAEQPGKALWVLTLRGVLIGLTTNGRVERWGPAQGIPAGEGGALLVDRSGDLWVGTAKGLVRLRNGHSTLFGSADGLPDEQITSLFEESPGRIWVGTAKGPALRDGERFVSWSRSPGVPSAITHAIARDRDGTVWIGTEEGLVRYRYGRFRLLTKREGLPSDTVSALLEDREGSLWVGTYGGGVLRLKDGSFRNFRAREGIVSDAVYCVAAARSGGLWIGTFDGRVEHWSPETPNASPRPISVGDRVRALYETRSGVLWIGTEKGLLRSGSKFREGLSSVSGIQQPVRAITEDAHGDLWVGTDGGGVFRLDGRNIVSYTRRDGLPGDVIRVILPARAGGVWIGTYSGLALLKDGKFRTWSTRDGLSSDLVRSLYEDADGTLWIGTYGGGITRLREGRMVSLTTREGLFNDVAYQILEDRSGGLWISCNRGVFRFRKADAEAIASGAARFLSSEAFGRTDGMADPECNGGSPGGAALPNGTLWFATSAGVATVNPARLYSNPVAPAVVIEDVVVDEKSRDPRLTLDLPPETRRIDFRYTALSFANPAKIRFSYRLDGLDEDWIDAKGDRVAHYTHLPPGRYTFRVIASNDSGVWNRSGATAQFTMEPRWDQTRSFWGALSALAVSSGWVLYRWRMARARAYRVLLERRVAEEIAKVRRLNGLLPICSSCKKVRDDKGYWSAIEQYVRERSDAEFSHSICPECLLRLYPEYAGDTKEEKPVIPTD
jgi:ligand-binding sensor domain-containing protein